MPSIQVNRLAFAHADAVPLFSDLTLHLAPGWHALVGANGAGKTTLLRLFAGAIRPDAGVVRVEPPGAVVRLCPQEVEACSPEVRAFAATPHALHGRLGLEPEALARWATLSPGERRRWQIGAALAAEPDVLLLDEPSNHLDADARARLLDGLSRFPGVGVVVSHDRELLDALAETTIRVDRGRVTTWTGGYSEARAAWEAAEAAEVAALSALQDEARRTRGRLGDARRERDAADRNRSSAVRMKDKNDHDARNSLAKGLAMWGEAEAGKRVGRVRGELRRLEARLADTERPRGGGGAIAWDVETPARRTLFALDEAALTAGDRVLLAPARVQLDRGDRVWLRGANGAGKSTLVAALLSASTLPPERVLHLPQELTAAERAEDVARLRKLPSDARGRLLAVAARIGLDAARLLASGAPSPGEARQLRIAEGLGRGAWVLVLDEPTNHLDLPAIERLETALASWPGALLLVTHDAAFAAACTTSTWTLTGGEIAR